MTETTVNICRTVASVRRHVVVDETPDLSWLDQTDDDMGEGFEAQAAERKAAYERGEWDMVGVYVTLHDQTGAEIERSGGLWNIESDSDPSWFADVARDEVAELAATYGVDLSGVEIEDA